MGLAEQHHRHQRVIIDDKDVPVPPNLGVDPASGAMSAGHTHEAEGASHIEASSVGDTFTLGELFTQWGVDPTPTQIGGMEAEAGETVIVISNAVHVKGDPRIDLRLERDQRIVLRLRSLGTRCTGSSPIAARQRVASLDVY